MKSAHPRDLTDSQWAVLNPLIQSRLAAKTAAVGHGERAVLFSTGYSGFCGLVHRGPICPIGTHHIKRVIGGFSNGYGRAF